MVSFEGFIIGFGGYDVDSVGVGVGGGVGDSGGGEEVLESEVFGMGVENRDFVGYSSLLFGILPTIFVVTTTITITVVNRHAPPFRKPVPELHHATTELRQTAPAPTLIAPAFTAVTAQSEKSDTSSIRASAGDLCSAYAIAFWIVAIRTVLFSCRARNGVTYRAVHGGGGGTAV